MLQAPFLDAAPPAWFVSLLSLIIIFITIIVIVGIAIVVVVVMLFSVRARFVLAVLCASAT